MRKIIARDQRVEIVADEIPSVKSSYVLIKTMYSIVSPGTELAIIENSAGKQSQLGYSAMGMVVEIGDGITDVEKGDLVACYGAPYVSHAEYLLVPKTLYAKVSVNVDEKEAALAGIGAIAIHALRVAKLQFGKRL
ncbi:hypothetical protein ACI2OX_04055 [Bacillus sp. N9]